LEMTPSSPSKSNLLKAIKKPFVIFELLEKNI